MRTSCELNANLAGCVKPTFWGSSKILSFMINAPQGHLRVHVGPHFHLRNTPFRIHAAPVPRVSAAVPKRGEINATAASLGQTGFAKPRDPHSVSAV